MAKSKYIETPEKLWEYFQAYKKEIKAKPFKVIDWVGGMGMQVTRKKERPLTMEGFELYCFEQGHIKSIDDYFSNTKGAYDEFSGICSRIRKAIKADQIEGGMAGMYNPSITQRLNGLTEKIQEDGNKEVTIKVIREKKQPPSDE